MSNPLKRKRINGRCCCCNPVFLLVAPIVTIVMVFAIILGGCFFAYNTWGKKYTGLEFTQIWNLGLNALSNLSTKEVSELIVNPYSDTDLDEFYKNFKDSAYIQDDCEIDLVDIITSSLLPKDVAGGADQSEQNPLSKIKFDANKLKADFDKMDGSQPYEPKKMSITDKQVAALVNQVLNTLLFDKDKTPAASAENPDIIPPTDGTEQPPADGGAEQQPNTNGASDIISMISLKLEQVIVRDYSVKADTVFEMTMSMPLREIVATAIKNATIAEPVTSIINFVSGILPKTLYLTVEMQPYHTTGDINISVNKMTADDTSNLRTLMNTLSVELNNPSINLDKLLGDLGVKVNETFTKIDSFVNLNFANVGGDNTIEMHPIEALLNLLKLNENEDGISEEILMKTLKAISVIDTSKIISDLNKFDPADIEKLNSQLKGKLPLSASYDLDISNIISGKGFGEITDNINFKDCDKSFFDMTVDDSSLILAGKDLGALIDIMLKKQSTTPPAVTNENGATEGVTASNDLSKYGLVLEQTIMEKDKILKNKYYITFTMSLDLKKLINPPPAEGETPVDKTDVQKLLENLLDVIIPEKTYLTAKTSFTVDDNGKIIHKIFDIDTENPPVTNPDAQADKTEFALNNLSFIETSNMMTRLATIFSKLSGDSGSSPFDINAISDMVDRTLRDALKSIDSSETMNGMKIGFAEKDGKTYYRLPGVYELVQKLAKADDEVNKPDSFVPLEDIRTIFSAMFTYTVPDNMKQPFDGANFTNLDTMFSSLNANMFFTSNILNKETLFGIGLAPGSQYGFDSVLNAMKDPTLLNVDNDENGMYKSAKTNVELQTRLQALAFAELISSKLSGIMIEGLGGINLIYSYLTTPVKDNIGNVYLKLGITAKIAVTGAEKYLPNSVFLELSVPFNFTGTAGQSTISICRLAGETQSIFKLVNGFSGSNSENPTFAYENILAKITASISEITDGLFKDETLTITYNNGLQEEQNSFDDTGLNDVNHDNYVINLTLPSIYDFMNNIIFTKKEQRQNPDNLRLMLQTISNYVFDNPYVYSVDNDAVFDKTISVPDLMNRTVTAYMTDKALFTSFNEQIQTGEYFSEFDSQNVETLQFIDNTSMNAFYNFGMKTFGAGDYSQLLEKLIPSNIFADVIMPLIKSEGTNSSFSVNGLNRTTTESAAIMDTLFAIINAYKADGDEDMTYDRLLEQINTVGADTIEKIKDSVTSLLPSAKLTTSILLNANAPLMHDGHTYLGDGSIVDSTITIGKGGYVKFVLQQ